MNLSFILPFYQKFKLFRMAMQFNWCFEAEGVEVICVLDDPRDEPPLIEFIKSRPKVNFRVIVNDWEHDWRPPCSAINVGIRHAEANHVAIMSPETIICLPRPDHLSELLRVDWRDSRCGVLWHTPDLNPEEPYQVTYSKLQRAEVTIRPEVAGAGLLLCQKYALEQVHGFNESRLKYGGDDDEIRSRLVRYGIRMSVEPTIKLFHPWHDTRTTRTRNNEDTSQVVLEWQRDSWGKEFSRVAWDWRRV